MSKKVYLDFGHGGSDPGATIPGLHEADINLQVGMKVKKKLEFNNILIETSRQSDVFLSLEQRCNKANKFGADCFVSIHCNSASSSNAKGVETFHYSGAKNDLATEIQNAIISSKAYTSNRGVKDAGFYVLKYTNMRAALVELAFISNTEDVKILKNKQEELSTAIAKGVCKWLGVTYKEDIPVVDIEDTIYQVIVGSFKNRDNAVDLIAELKTKGYNAFIDIE